MDQLGLPEEPVTKVLPDPLDLLDLLVNPQTEEILVHPDLLVSHFKTALVFHSTIPKFSRVS